MCGCSKTVVSVLTLIFIACAILCHIIALATSHWLRSSSETQEDFLNIGLFTACFSHYIHQHDNPPKIYDGCHPLSSDTYVTIRDWLVPSWLVISQWLAIIALILAIVALVLFIILVIWFVCQCVSREKDDSVCATIIAYAAPIIMIIAGMFMMSVVMIWADNAFRLQCKDFWLGGEDPFVNHLSWSWLFEIFATILSFIAGGFLIWMAVLEARDRE